MHTALSPPPRHHPPPPAMPCLGSGRAPRGSGVQGEDQLPHPPRPGPAPALHAAERHHARDTCRQQRQRIESALAHPQRPRIGLQRGGVDIALLPRQVVMALVAFGTCSAVPTARP
jgi:hypothetical protein